MRVAFLYGAAALLAGSAAWAQPVITFEGTRVVVSKVTPGGRVACYGVAHDFQAVFPELLRWARELTDADADGAVALDIGREVPHDSQWFAADLTTGLLASASPRSGPPREVPLEGPGITGTPGAPRAALRVGLSAVDIFVVRQNQGAWVLLGGDGAAGDADGQSDGSVSAELTEFQPVGKAGAAPAAFAQADLVVVVDPFSLEYSIVEGKGQ